MRYLKGICALVLVLGICLPAQATVQNIRVGGEIEIEGIARDNWDLDDAMAAPGDDENWIESTVKLQVEAEFMDDVAARIRLKNERVWGVDRQDVDIAGVGLVPADRATDVELDLAYLTLNHMFGFPVKATLGRQEILFGEEFLVGDDDPFDALRLTYQVFPYTVDLFTAKIDDGLALTDYDVDLTGLNIHFNHLDIATFDLGYFVGRNRGPVATATETRALSLRGEGEILIQGAPGLTVKGEKVWQRGDATGVGVDLEASAWYLGAEYTLLDNPYEPYFGVTFIFMSGNEELTPTVNEAFDPLFEDKEWGEIAEELELHTNAKIWRLAAGLRPADALSVGLSYYISELEEVAAGSDEFGDELNLNLTFDYTEDVQFGLCVSWFNPGDYHKPLNDTATQVVGSVKVSF